ncbi:integral membrane protein TerC family-domain-containing protein [Tribonema minus]|uniref:Integral membrane protein TerC family-domain-containing protein n=1 Tax=Tribonema minus TaxID=303371 RepID=A0A835ZA94_9STRA|nr:integral membrane protein TerC family-domain-containing protein [Tribonema minus]
MLGSAVAFGLGTMAVKGRQSGLEFFAGYLVEQSLSVDNLFVFIMLFEYFKVPAAYQGRVLTWGIIGAVSMRAVMIVVGVAAIQRFRGVILAFAAILLASSVKLLTEKEDEDGDLSNNIVLRISKFFVRSTDKYEGEKFFTVVDGKKMATPLLLCLVCIELSDFVFAVDSIPAVLGVSKDTFIVYSSNVFAILALRSLYTLVSHAITDLPYLKPSVALVLGFVGLKMCAEYFHYEIGIGVSLSVVAVLLSGGVGASIWDNRRRARLGLSGRHKH